jgi:hypothetical protein
MNLFQFFRYPSEIAYIWREGFAGSVTVADLSCKVMIECGTEALDFCAPRGHFVAVR